MWAGTNGSGGSNSLAGDFSIDVMGALALPGCRLLVGDPVPGYIGILGDLVFSETCLEVVPKASFAIHVGGLPSALFSSRRSGFAGLVHHLQRALRLAWQQRFARGTQTLSGVFGPAADFRLRPLDRSLSRMRTIFISRACRCP